MSLIKGAVFKFMPRRWLVYFKAARYIRHGVEDVLTENQAVIVPPQNPTALRKAIERAYTNRDYRRLYEERGYRYAMSLEGEDRLMESLNGELRQLKNK